MCLLSKQDIYTADSDIMCYKVGKASRNGIISPCELFFFLNLINSIQTRNPK